MHVFKWCQLGEWGRRGMNECRERERDGEIGENIKKEKENERRMMWKKKCDEKCIKKEERTDLK